MLRVISDAMSAADARSVTLLGNRRLVGSIRLRRSSTLVRAVTADVWSD